ncbi:MAG TPA: PHP domain-containing protein [Nitrospira sp.]
MSRIDLHLHTTHSDGSLRPSDVLTLAKQANVSALAITDHDITTGIPEAMATGETLGIEVIPGVEISSFDGKSELHILGYCVRWQDVEFNRRLATLRESRHRRNPLIIERLREAGLDVTYEEVRALAGTESVGRPHIAQLLMQKKYVSSAKEAFDRYLAEGRPAYVARELPTPAEAISWIREAKGVALLAHPTWVKESGEGLRTCVTTLKEAGLGGIEVHYSTHSKSQTAGYLDLAHRLDLLITGGSDFHGLTKPDIEVGSGRGDLKVNPRLLAPLKAAAARI